jgi:hypothetical protein
MRWRPQVAILVATLGGCSEPSDGGFEPYMPPPTEHPYVDAVYLQEFNHTTNEMEPGIGALVSVLLPPDGLAGFETPTQVTPRGLVTHDNQGRLRIVEIWSGRLFSPVAWFWQARQPCTSTMRAASPRCRRPPG